VNFKYAIFDMDGTLVDSMPAWRHVEFDVIEKLYGVKFSDEEKEKLEYLTFSELLREAASLKNITIDYSAITEESYALMTERYLNGQFEFKAYVKEFLAFLKSKNVGIAVATATRKSLSVPFLKEIGLYDYIDFVFTTEDDAKIGKSKSSLVYDMALEALGGTKEEAVVFEDVLNCMKTCKANGYQVIAVHDKYQKYTKDKILETADFFINTYKELME